MPQLATPSGRLLHPRENLSQVSNLASVAAGTESFCDGCSSVMLDIRGTFVGTVTLEGTVDGSNWTPILLYPVNQASIVPVLGPTAIGLWTGDVSKFSRVRPRMTVWTSGTANCTVVSDNSPFVVPDIAHVSLTATAAVSTAVTLTIPAPGAGLRQYVTGLSIERFATALLTAAAAPIIITSTGLVGTPSWNTPLEAAAQGTMFTRDIQFPTSIPNAAQNATAVITYPIVTGAICRLTAYWRIGQ
jgi:hypothetical protein